MQNPWGGKIDVDDDDKQQGGGGGDGGADWDRASLAYQQHLHDADHLDEVQKSWLLAPPGDVGGSRRGKKKKEKYVDFGCFVCSRKLLKWTLIGFGVALLVIALPTVLAKTVNRHKHRPPPPDDYSVALHKALLFFNAQKSGKLPKDNGIAWRGDSALQDGFDIPELKAKGGLVGGYYDAGDNTKFHFPMSFALTMLSWSVIEYPHKYEAMKEYDHARELIKWGTDYLLKTFNSSATKIDHIYCQVGGSQNNSNAEPNDHDCWERPEDMDYKRPVQTCSVAADLGAEMAAAFASASLVFQDDFSYSTKLKRAAQTVFAFARDGGKRATYSRGNDWISPFYNSTGYYDEYMWGATWLYYATGNNSYITLATHPGIASHARAFRVTADKSVLSWDNKIPAATLLLTRLRIFLNPGGLIQLNIGKSQSLQYVANTVFLMNLYADYLDAIGVPGWTCGPNYFKSKTLRTLATSQYPRQVHHRGASIPRNGVKYTCKGGFKWLNSKKPNPNTIDGAMVGGPDRFDNFKDDRKQYGYTEPTVAGNAGLVAALVSLTSTGGNGVDRNLIFSGVPPFYPQSPPPPAPWRP
ncbi:hypothetical protein V2J09_023690 [Rumex salicifolius]